MAMARQSRNRTSRVGDFLSRSSRLMYVRWSPADLASCAWVRPAASRAFRSSVPITPEKLEHAREPGDKTKVYRLAWEAGFHAVL